MLSSITPLDVCGWLWLAWLFIWIVAAPFSLKKKQDEKNARLQHTIPTIFGIVTVFHHGEVPALDWGALYDSAALKYAGIALTVAGHAFSIWARLHLGKYWSGTVALKEGHKIISTGPYAFVRHPIYTGLFLAVLGSAMAAATIEAFVGLAVMFCGYIVKWRREEKLLIGEFGQEYRDYMARTKAIIPYIF